MKAVQRRLEAMAYSVMVVLNPSVSTALGKKFLKPLDAKCMCCMNTKSHSLGSLLHSTSPFHVVLLGLASTVSLKIRC